MKGNYQANAVAEVIKLFQAGLLSVLKEDLVGIYIIGSYGLDDFNPDLSDLDFVVITHEPISQDKLNLVRDNHLEIESSYPQPPLSGIYIEKKNLGKTKEEIETISFFNNGALKTTTDPARFFEINPITWIELKINAHTIWGEPAQQLNNPILWEQVYEYLHQNINSYWKKYLVEPRNPSHKYYYDTLLKGSENAWCVAGVARQLYTLREQKITSKKGACLYFLDQTPKRFRKILQDTINFREGRKARPAWRQKKDTLSFIAYCISAFNEAYLKE